MSRKEKEADYSGAARILLHAGPVSLFLDVDSLFIRRLSFGGAEILRGAYPAVRDRNWGTLKPEVTVVALARNPDSFEVQLLATFGEPEPIFSWEAVIKGGADGRISFRITGHAIEEVITTRAGFCILHPASAAGLPCSVRHSDGSVEDTAFPDKIAPHQPFFDVSAITHQPAPGLRATVEMAGDVFETEDQRNWTDASFKTYCRPLSKPYPYTLEKGSSFEQEMVVTVATPAGAKPSPPPSEALLLSLPHNLVSRPRLGLLLTDTKPLSAHAMKALHAVAPEHLRVDLLGSIDRQLEQLEFALTGARALHCRILAGIEIRDESHAAQLAKAIRTLEGINVIDWLPLNSKSRVTTEVIFNATAKAWAENEIPGKIGAGVAGNFADFNRLRPAWDGIDFVACSISPQVHAFDRLSIVETLAVQPLIVRQMRDIASAPAYASPVSLVQLYNPVATTDAEEPPEDPRLHMAFGAAWTLASLAALSVGGASNITMHAATGHHGLLPTDEADKNPLLLLFRELAGLDAQEWGVIEDLREGVPCGLVIRRQTGLTALVANLSASDRPLQIAENMGRHSSQVLLCSWEGKKAGEGCLPPWSVTRLDFDA